MELKKTETFAIMANDNDNCEKNSIIGLITPCSVHLLCSLDAKNDIVL